jgi:hypothetical protein
VRPHGRCGPPRGVSAEEPTNAGANDRIGVPDVSLPPRSPELNGQENVWQFMRQNWLSNRVSQCFDDMVGHCCDAWNTLVEQPWKIMSLAGRAWAEIGQTI